MRMTNKTLDRIQAMLDRAIEGEPIETTFDESKASAIETKLHKYLCTMNVQKNALKEERERITALISDISHQTKTPIANLLLYAELASECADDERRSHHLGEIMRQSEHLRFLVDALVKTSRIENGIIAPKPEKQSLQLLLDDIRELFPEVSIEDTPSIAIYDRKWTIEALANLIDNAYKYGASSVHVSVTAYTMFVRITVIDDGIGIRESDIPKIFTRFYRAETAREVGGVGIGLTLAREIVTKQGGYIKVDSKESEGSSFHIFLPST